MEQTADPRPMPADTAGDGSDFHLVETFGSWTLTVTMTDRLRAALAAEAGEAGSDGAELQFSVLVEPNLLPGRPFDAHLQIREP